MRRQLAAASALALPLAVLLPAGPAQAAVQFGCQVAPGRTAAVLLDIRTNTAGEFWVETWKYNTDAPFLADRIDVQVAKGDVANPDATWFSWGGSTDTENDVRSSFGPTTTASPDLPSRRTGPMTNPVISVQFRVWDASSDGACSVTRTVTGII